MESSRDTIVKLGSHLLHCHPRELQWIDWAMPDAQFKLLHADQASGCFTVLLRFMPGAEAPIHRHVGTVEGFMVEGSFFYTDQPERVFNSGSYLWESHGTVHKPVSKNGAIILLIFDGSVEGLDEQGNVIGRVNWKWHVDKWNAAGNNYIPTGDLPKREQAGSN